MDTKQFRKAFDDCLKSHGFSKTGSYYQRVGDGVICVIGLQRSAYSGGCYVNVGYAISDFRSRTEPLRDVDADLRVRYYYRADEGEADLFVPDGFVNDEQLRRVLGECIRDSVEGNLNMAGLRAFIVREPVLRNRLSLRATEFLGFA